MFRCRVRVRIDAVPMKQNVPGDLMEAVSSVLAVADRHGQRVPLSDSVFVNGSERSTALPLGLLVVCLVPQRL